MSGALHPPLQRSLDPRLLETRRVKGLNGQLFSKEALEALLTVSPPSQGDYREGGHKKTLSNYALAE